ncbi:MAG: hypothetical protein AAGJ81_01405 [Verrucomicrobiota bacterium]
MNLLTDRPIPFTDAIRRNRSKIPVPSALRSQEWAQVPVGLRDRSFFSAGVNRLKDLDRMQGIVDEALTLNPDDVFADRSRFVADMRASLGGPEGDSGRLTDLASRRRLELIYDFQIEDAYEYGRWKQGQDPDLLDAFPARELIRVEVRQEERDWRSRWAAAGGRTVNGRMVALKNDPIWTAISRFDRPWPPFDFGSGMGIRDLSREEAEDLGLIEPGPPPPGPEDETFNREVELSVTRLPDYYREGLKNLFGSQLVVSEGRVSWRGAGDLVADAYRAVEAGDQIQQTIPLGFATDRLTKAAGLARNVPLEVTTDTLRHINRNHGSAATEVLRGQVPVTPELVSLLPAVLADPDEILPGDQRDEVRLSRTIAGIGQLQVFAKKSRNRLRASTFWITKKAGDEPRPNEAPSEF